MSLETHVTNRYGGSSSEFLIGLTNCFIRTATSIDTTQLTRAADDVKAQMQVYAGVSYDDSATTNPLHYQQHIATACPCVIAKLKQWTGQVAGADEEWERCRLALIAMSKVGARDRFSMLTSSQLETSDPTTTGETVRPQMDSERFDGYVPNNRGGQNDSLGPQVGS